MYKFRGTAVVAAALLLAIPVAAQSNAAGPISGCVVKNGDSYTLTDDASKTTFQLKGGNVKAGQHVQVSGTPGASNVFDVQSVTKTSGTCAGAQQKSGFHLNKAHVIGIAAVGGLVIFGVVKGAGRIGPAF